MSCPLIICNHLLSTFFFSCHLSYRTNQHVRSIFNQLKLQPYHLLSSHMSFQLFAVDLNFFVTLTLGFSTSARGRNLHIKMLQRKLRWVGFQLMLFCQRYLSLSLCVREWVYSCGCDVCWVWVKLAVFPFLMYNSFHECIMPEWYDIRS